MDQARGMDNLPITDTVGIVFTMFDYNQRRAPWSDGTFRKAMAHAIDIDTIVDVVAAGYVMLPADSTAAMVDSSFSPEAVEALRLSLGIAIIVLVLSIFFIQRGLEVIVNPRLKGR
ncbi:MULTISPECIES: ABC transporter substrate-binding protein [Dethiosulfovibrio]|uniref:ABC transporter substrate-binding protein n=2 Tax=Dethiosulfovibrio TaxID=47054 RepID=A0ABS9ER38_9BACT|nr:MULTISPECIES: ABC transporter substrate-binding protein [Dethiosulfovibrio]MCF4113229.1 ABC transporter substrate-binding protein [Dethiosulfovibrio russensis]MCF4142293.1 ABC transporter substrate-binding protein [Dethiosulfovibrio marinus]MCF4144601.1 ABC transporter substrate-binding protein [Dethiosulfovibrio acidaminovorans]